MRTITLYRIIKLQIASFKDLGFDTELKNTGFSLIVQMSKLNKCYVFCESDWGVLSKQLANLYMFTCKRKYPSTDIIGNLERVQNGLNPSFLAKTHKA